MKASVIKITEGAKLRDTVNRNIIMIADTGKIGSLLYGYQVTVSQVAGTKRTYIILRDDDNTHYMLDFNIAKIEGNLQIDGGVQQDQCVNEEVRKYDE